MAKFDVKLAAAIAEITAALAVVVSLLFVVYSINQNTAALQASNDNFLYDIQNQRLSAMSGDGELAEIIVKFDAGQTLTDVEEFRYRKHLAKSMNIWEIAYIRRREGLMPETQWESWDRYMSMDMPRDFPHEWWSDLRHGYDANFADHVDAAYVAYATKH